MSKILLEIEGRILTESIQKDFDVSNFGAIGDGITDDTASIQACLDYIYNNGIEGVEVFFPNKVYKVGTLIPKSRSLKFKGQTRRTGDTFDNICNGDGGAVLKSVGNPTILLDSSYELQGFSIEDLTIASDLQITEPRKGTAIEFNMSNPSKLLHDFYFNRIAIVNHDTCFKLTREQNSLNKAAINFTCENSWLLFNNKVHEYTNNAQWNVFRFENNYASSNNVLPHNGISYSYGVSDTIHVAGVCISIEKNILESNPNAITVDGFYPMNEFRPFAQSSLKIENNYFEGNWGNHLIRVNGFDGFEIGFNYHDDAITGCPQLKNRVHLDSCKNGIVKMKGVRLVACVDVDLFTESDSETILDTGDSYLFYANSIEKSLKEFNKYNDVTCSHYVSNKRLSCIESICSGEELTLTSTFKEISIDSPINSVGKWLVLNLPMLFDEAIGYPRFDLMINGVINRRFDFIENSFEKNKLYNFVFAVKILEIATDIKLKIYPYANQVGIKKSTVMGMTAFTVDNYRDIKSWLNKDAQKSSNPPSFGNWKKGDKIQNSNPTSGNYVGWICTSSGNPGIWKGYGLIQ